MAGAADDFVIRATKLCKTYRLYDRPVDRLKEWLTKRS